MTGSVALDVVIGLVFIYLLYSLLASLIQEIIATNLSFRAKILEVGIIRMLNDVPTMEGFGVFRERIMAVLRLFKRKNSQLINGTLADHFYKSPLVKYLAQDSWHSRPSYLSSSNFSKVIIDLLRGPGVEPGQDFRPLIQNALDEGIIINDDAGNNYPIYSILDNNNNRIINNNSDSLRFLKSLWADSQGDVEKFKAHLEKWFDDTMERAVGWYKQYTQLILFGIGFFIAAFFNVDTILIVEKLSNNPKLTTQFVQQAGDFVKAHPNFEEELKKLSPAETKALTEHRDYLFSKSKELLDKDILNMNQLLGLGWQKKSCWGSGWLWTGWRPKDSTLWSLTLLGWFLTALAISMGAPFWFDLLNRLMKLRGSLATATNQEKEKSASDKKVIIPKG